jgi:uncharacterized protein (TIGR02145 family)
MRYLFAWLAFALVLAGCNSDRMVDGGGGTVPTPVPAVPTLSSPSDAAPNLSVPVRLAWDSASGAASYGLQVSRNSGFTDVVYTAEGIRATSQNISGLVSGLRYWWRVNAKNNGGTSAWSTPRNFSTFTLDAPAPASPPDNAADQGLTTTVSWSPSPEAASYFLQVSTEGGFTLANRFVVDDSGLTVTSLDVAGLVKTSTYYWRIRAKAGALYSNWSATRKFRTLTACTATSTTIEGAVYETVSIRDQCWLQRNVDDGTMIASGASAADNGVTEKYCYDNDPANCATFGGLYSWDEAMQYDATAGTRGICPEGWRIPTLADINTLATAINDSSLARNYVAVQDGGTDLAGFTARLAGYYDFGYFGEKGDVTKFWISEKDNAGRAYYWILGKTGFSLVWVRADANAGYSVRCVSQ